MIRVVWVDRNISDIEDYVKQYKLNQFAEIFSFNSFLNARNFIVSSSFPIECIISSYSTLTWSNVLTNSIEYEIEDCFQFYGDIKNICSGMKFVMYSGMGDLDSRVNLFIKKNNFYFIPKYSGGNLSIFLKEEFMLCG